MNNSDQINPEQVVEGGENQGNTKEQSNLFAINTASAGFTTSSNQSLNSNPSSKSSKQKSFMVDPDVANLTKDSLSSMKKKLNENIVSLRKKKRHGLVMQER